MTTNHTHHATHRNDNGTAHGRDRGTAATGDVRPWDNPRPGELWEITGVCSCGRDRFVRRLAITANVNTPDGGTETMYAVVEPRYRPARPIPPGWITNARPLLIVERDNPAQVYRPEVSIPATTGPATTHTSTPATGGGAA